MTSGGRIPPLLRVVVVVAGFVALVDAINVFTALHDAARHGETLPLWQPVTWEATSGIGELIACPIIFAAFRIAPPGRGRWRRALLTHAVASVVFSALHIALMMALREVIYRAGGLHYRVEAGAALYEYRKDLLAYLVLGGLWLLLSSGRSAVAPPMISNAPSASAQTTFDIAEGPRTLRVEIEHILAVRSAGNYVEFILADGRRPLMRATLKDVADKLRLHGYLRTHRSWLISAKDVVELKRSGSGGYTAILAGGVEAPVSRRLPDGLEQIRTGRGV